MVFHQSAIPKPQLHNYETHMQLSYWPWFKFTRVSWWFPTSPKKQLETAAVLNFYSLNGLRETQTAVYCTRIIVGNIQSNLVILVMTHVQALKKRKSFEEENDGFFNF